MTKAEKILKLSEEAQVMFGELKKRIHDEIAIEMARYRSSITIGENWCCECEN